LAKSPAIAAILNFFIWGLGYLYLGKKINFAIILVIGNIVSLYALTFPRTPALGYDLTYALGVLVVSVAFAYDASQLAVAPSLQQP